MKKKRCQTTLFTSCLVIFLLFATESASQDLNLPEESIYKDTFEPSPNKGIIPTQGLTEFEFKINKSCPLERSELRRNVVDIAVFSLYRSKSIFELKKDGSCKRTSEAFFLWKIDKDGRHKDVTSLNERGISKESFEKDPVFESLFNGIYSTHWSGAQHDGTCNASVFFKYCTPETKKISKAKSSE